MPSPNSRFVTRFAALTALLVPAVPAQDADDAAPRRPNVLWLLGEDLGPELSCYGTRAVTTPRLDRLAAEGVRFTRAFTTTPVCSTSRSSFMTGMYATTIGAHNHRSHRDDGYRLPTGVRVLTDRLRDAGYYTANVRQVPPPADGATAATDGPTVPPGFWRGTGKTDWNFTYGDADDEGARKRPFDGSRFADLAPNQPFYAQINFSETHRGGAWNRAHERIATPADPAAIELPPYYPDHPTARADWAQYLNTVMALDRKVGNVLDHLEASGLADDTIVVFFGDHGRAHVRGKQWCYDSGLRVPLIVRWPRNFPPPRGWRAGQVDGRLVASIDLTASTLTWCGVDVPASMQGRPLLANGGADEDREFVFGTRDRCDETVFRIRTVRSTRWRYVRNGLPERPFLQLNRYKERSYPMLALMRELHARDELGPIPSRLFAPSRPAEELYDLDADPWEIANLATDPAHRETLERLRKTLDAWIVASDDRGQVPEPEAVVQKWEQTMAERDRQRERRRR